MSEFNDVCARADKGEIYLEARNALTVAFPEDYAMLQRKDIANKQRVSGIYLCVADKTQDASAGVMVPAAEFSKIKAIAEQSLGKNYWNNEEMNIINELADDAKLGFAYSFYANCTFEKIIDDLLKLCGGAVAGKIDASNLARYLGGALTGWRAMQEETMEGIRSCSPMFRTSFPLYKEYSARIAPARCSYNQSGDGTAKFSTAKIERRVLDKSDDVSKNPWSVRISSFIARTSEKTACGYDAETVRNRIDCEIHLSDSEIYDFCYDVEHFVSVWEMAHCVELVRQGCRYKDELSRTSVRAS